MHSDLSISSYTCFFSFFALVPYPYWIYLFRFQILLNFFINTLYNEFKILVKYSQSNLIILISLFFIILRNNFFGLFPYIFTSSST